MGDFAYNNEKCMFFIGGNAEKSDNEEGAGTSNSAGCTKEWWDTQLGGLKPGDAEYQAAAETAMGKLMQENGDPIIDGEFEVVDWVEEGDNEITFKHIDDDPFTGVEVGMLASVEDDDTCFYAGDGIFKVIRVAGDLSTVTLEGQVADGDIFVGAMSDFCIGGAFEELEDLQLISAADHTQEVWCNKDFSVEGEEETEDWGYGSLANNTWLRIMGFYRVPYDMHEGGTYYQTRWSKWIDGLNPDSAFRLNWDAEDCHGLQIDGIHNVIFENMWTSGVSDVHLDNREQIRFINVPSNIIFINCSSEGKFPFGGNSPGGNDTGVEFYNCFSLCHGDLALYGFRAYGAGPQHYIDCLCVMPLGAIGEGFYSYGPDMVLINCVIIQGNRGFSAPFDGKHLLYNCTFYKQDTCCIRGGGITVPALITATGCIFHPKLKDRWAFEFHSGCTVYDNHNCGYAPDGKLDYYGEVQAGIETVMPGFHSLEVDPNLDTDEGLEPLTESVRRGGRHNSAGDDTSIGSVQTMNTAVIEAATNVALAAYDGPTRVELTADKDELLTELAQILADTNELQTDDLPSGIAVLLAMAGAIQAKTDGLNFTGNDVKATLDSEAVKLAADGWDGLSITEPSGDPDGWTVPQKLMWLIMRFLNKHTSDNFDGIKVYKADDTLATTQSVTEAAGVKTVTRVNP